MVAMNRTGIFKLLSALVLCMSVNMAQGLAQPLRLASHQAVYDLNLDQVHQNGSFEAVRGRVVMKVEQSCDGLIVNQRMVLEMINFDGDAIISDYTLSTWEDNDGRMMRFDMANMLNGQLLEKYSGIAQRDEAGVTVTFRVPPNTSLTLPDGVIFPGEHSRQVIKAAAAGRRLLSAKVYDGNGEEGLSDTLAVIGKGQTLLQAEDIAKPLQGRTYWPLQISYFDLRGQQTEPDYKISMKIFDNGVATDLHLDYMDFSLKGELSELTMLEMEKCS